MEINGVYYTEPELAAKVRQMQETIDRLDSENRKLTEKLEEIGTAFNEQVSLVGWHEEREKEYKRLLLLACADIHFIAETFNTECGSMACSECPFTADECTQWVHEKEALDLIGEEP